MEEWDVKKSRLYTVQTWKSGLRRRVGYVQVYSTDVEEWLVMKNGLCGRRGKAKTGDEILM